MCIKPSESGDQSSSPISNTSCSIGLAFVNFEMPNSLSSSSALPSGSVVAEKITKKIDFV